MRGTVLVTLGLFAVAASGSRERGPAAPPAAKPYGLGTPPFAQLPVASCASASCHGGGRPGRSGSEHTTWAPEVADDGPCDPHAKAYRVLFNTDSARMGKLLGVAAPHRDPLCLKCHAVEAVRPASAVADGVGCGACHGPAEKWLTAHYSPGWKGLSNRTKWDDYGFVPARNLVARSLNCVGCHVGDADRDVSHDLLAAGHPRLAFESARFHASPTYRKHWAEKTTQPAFEVRAWVAGQAATLRAATDLLRVRAGRADDPKAAWPEFAGLACYSCHQSIGQPEARRSAGTAPRPVGLPGWEVWSNTAAGVAADLCPEVFAGVAPPALGELAALRTLMAKRVPDPKAVVGQAGKAVAELDAWLAALQAAEDRDPAPRVSADTLRAFAHRLSRNALSADRSSLADHDWDALAANYLGCAAAYHAAGGRAAVPGWADPVRGLAAGLRFPARLDRAELDRVRDRFRDLADLTAGPRGKP